jgi:arylsulfatase A-like enzyme
MDRPNVLFITLDQFRGDTMSCAGHPLVRTPHLDHLAANGLRLGRHYAQAAPCAPGRAALYTGTYQMNNRVVANGTPLDARFDNVALAARRAGYDPVLLGYSDQGVDPRTVPAGDPRLSTYEGVLPGFAVELDLTGEHLPWLAWLGELGHDVHDARTMLSTEHERPVEHSVSTFLTDRLLAFIDRQDGPWFAHASYLRPHPPYRAAGSFASLYDPDDCPDPLPVPAERHPLHDRLLGVRHVAAPQDPSAMRALRAQYYGMVSEVDAQLGRVWAHLVDTGAWDDTVVVVTADHGEQLGDQGLMEKLGFFESSYHVVGIVRDPRQRGGLGTVVESFTENVDIMPTLCEAMGIEVPAQCDGVALTAFLAGTEPPWWRDAAYYEWDWRDTSISAGAPPDPSDRRLERLNLAVRRSRDRAYVQFGDGSALCFDLSGDPTWNTRVTDPAVVCAEAQAMLTWRAQHTDRTMTGMLLRDGGIGRVPAPVAI